eukprot:295303-Prorocentrum_minimum.AAC.1
MDIGQARGHYDCAIPKGTEEKTRPYDRSWLRSPPTFMAAGFPRNPSCPPGRPDHPLVRAGGGSVERTPMATTTKQQVLTVTLTPDPLTSII